MIATTGKLTVEGRIIELCEGDRIYVSFKGKDHIFFVDSFTKEGYPVTRMLSWGLWGMAVDFPSLDGMVITAVTDSNLNNKYKPD